MGTQGRQQCSRLQVIQLQQDKPLLTLSAACSRQTQNLSIPILPILPSCHGLLSPLSSPLSPSPSLSRKVAPLSPSLPLSKARNSGDLKSPFLSVSISNGGAQRFVEARAGHGGGAISSLIQGPGPKRFLGDDYVVKKVTAKQVQEMVKGKREHPLIVGFYATWCGPCVHMAQELEMLAVEYEDSAIFVKVNTDEEYEFARDMQVRGLPTLYFISPDPKKNAIRTEGLVPSSMIKDIVDNEM